MIKQIHPHSLDDILGSPQESKVTIINGVANEEKSKTAYKISEGVLTLIENVHLTIGIIKYEKMLACKEKDDKIKIIAK